MSTTAGAFGTVASCSATARPSRSGNWMSSRTISGRRAATASTASAPSVASPTTSKPSACSNARAEARKAAWSSTMSTVGPMPQMVPHATGPHIVASPNHRDWELPAALNAAGPGNGHRSIGSRTVASHNHILKPPRMFRPADGPKLLTGQASAERKGWRTGKDRRARIPAHSGHLEGASMRRLMKWLTAIVVCAGMALPAAPAQAKAPGPNGRIAFSRGSRDDNTVTYTANPDGSHIRRLFPGFSGGPRWSPDGSQVSVFAACTDGEENCAATIVDPDTGTFRQFKWPDPTLET